MRTAFLLMCLACPSVLAPQGPQSPPRQAVEQPAPMRPVDDGEFQLRVNGRVDVPVGDTTDVVWVINGDASIDGAVREAVGVVNGTARVSGHVAGSVIVVNGHLELLPGAVVDEDVVLHQSTITRAPGVIVSGGIRDRVGFSFGVAGMWVAWLGFTVVILVAGALFVAIAPHVLEESASFLPEHGGRSALTALALVIGLPTAAIMSFVTVIGIPLGLTIVLVIIPALTFLGYLVAGAAAGAMVMSRRGASSRARLAEVALGLVMLQVVGAVPGIGGPAVLIASQLGVGALVARAWSSRRREGIVMSPAGANA